MKVNIEAQSICISELRGIPSYTVNIIKSLVNRNTNNYSVSFFDYKGERNNRQFIEHYLCDFLKKNNIKECNDVNFKDIIQACETDDFSFFDKNYSRCFDFNADIFHFPNSVVFPYKLINNAVVTVHDIMPIIFKGKHYWSDSVTNGFINVHKHIAKNNGITIIADSECTKCDIVNYLGIDEKRIHVTPLGYDDCIYFHEENPEVIKSLCIDGPYIVYLGSLDMRKGIIDIIKAFSIIRSRYKGLKLVLAGKKELIFDTKYKDLLKCIPLDDIIFTGYVTDNQKRALLSSAEVFLFPSEYEGFGLPVLEAMACGCPVITTNISSIPEVGGNSVLYVSPNEPEEIVCQTEKIMCSSELKNEYISKGYKRAQEFSWDRTAKLTEMVYKTVYKNLH